MKCTACGCEIVLGRTAGVNRLQGISRRASACTSRRLGRSPRDGTFPMTTVLHVTQAHKRFGTTQALDGAEVTLERGQLLLLLGPNGAGKTTLIRAVAGRVR